MASDFSSIDVSSAYISARVRIDFRQLSGFLICSHTLEFESIDGCMCVATDYVARVIKCYPGILLVPTYHLQYFVKEKENG